MSRIRNHLEIERGYFETILTAKEQFKELLPKTKWGKQGRHAVSWGSFLCQATLFLEAFHFTPYVKANRYNQYVYGGICPNCGCEEYPLRNRKGEIIWKIDCAKCGITFIAIA